MSVGNGERAQQEWLAWLRGVLTPATLEEHDVLSDRRRLATIAALGADEVEHVQPLVGDLLAGASARTAAPVGLVNVVLSGAQVIAGEHGLSGWMAQARGIPVEWSPCARVVRTGAPYVVADLAADAATRENPLHLVDGFRSYAGVPLRAGDGQVIGSVCVLDTAVHDFDEADLDVLHRVARETARRLGEDAARRAGSSGPEGAEES